MAVSTHTYTNPNSHISDVCRWNLLPADGKQEWKLLAHSFARALGVSEETSKLITMPSPEKAIAKEGTTRGAKTDDPTVETLSVGNGVYLTAFSLPFHSLCKSFAHHHACTNNLYI